MVYAFGYFFWHVYPLTTTPLRGAQLDLRKLCLLCFHHTLPETGRRESSGAPGTARLQGISGSNGQGPAPQRPEKSE